MAAALLSNSVPRVASVAVPRARQRGRVVLSRHAQRAAVEVTRPSRRTAVLTRVSDEDKPDWLRRASLQRPVVVDDFLGLTFVRFWRRSLEDNAIEDDEVAQMLEEARKDPKAFEAKIRGQSRLSEEQMMRERAVASSTMKVTFRKVDPFDLWIWVELEEPPDDDKKLYLEEVFKAWFVVGRLGGFNAVNLQVQRHTNEARKDVSVSTIDYKEPEGTETALFHAMTDPEYKDNWLRCWFDLGTSDDIALDVLLNTLFNLSEEYVPIKQVVLGGVNRDWVEGTEGMAQRVGSFAPG